MNVVILCPPEIPVPLHGYAGIERICVDLLHEIIFKPIDYDAVTFCKPGADAADHYLHAYPHDLSKLDMGQDLTLDFTHTKLGAPWFKRSNYIAMNVLTDAESGVNDVYQSIAVADGFHRPQGKVIYGGLDPSRYKYSAKKEDYLLFLGRMSKIKRPDIAVQVALATHKRIVMAGIFKGPMAEYPDPNWPSMVRGLDENHPSEVEIVEEPDDEKKAELLSKAMALIMPSQWSVIGSKESFGLTSVEALMSGTPVITSGEGGIAEVVTEETGARCSSLDEYIDAIRHLDRFRPVKCHERGMKFTSARLLDNLLAHWEASR